MANVLPKLRYVATDEEGNVKRDGRGIALMMTDEEIEKSGLPVYDQTIVAYADNKPIGMVANEFGAVGVWVETPHQKLGIGSDLLVMYMEQNPRFMMKSGTKLGQMTPSGEKMTRTAYRKLVAKHGEEFGG